MKYMYFLLSYFGINSHQVIFKKQKQNAMMKNFLLGIVVCTLLLGSCKKDSGSTKSNPKGLSDNSFKIIKPDGSEQTVTITNVSMITNNEFSYIARFSVGAASTYDRVAVGFSSMPADGEYPVIAAPNGHTSELPAGKAQQNTTFDGVNYFTTTASSGVVTISTVNGKKKVTFENLELSKIGTVAAGGSDLPVGSKITGVIVQP